ncbi:RNA helicase [Aphelenchoides fujianensis]|nr:RNA helicase [Aphelenchoides fujianensis]
MPKKKAQNKKNKADADVPDVLIDKLAALSLQPAAPPAVYEPPKADEPTEMLADPMRVLREHRELNVGHLVDDEEAPTPKKDPDEKKDRWQVYEEVGSYFPEDYTFLLGLRQLDEKTLRRYPEIWPLITKRPNTTAELIRREVALIALNWAQELLDIKRPRLVDATWMLHSTRYLDATVFLPGAIEVNKSIVILELTRPKKKKKEEGSDDEADDQTNFKSHLRKGTIVRLAASSDDDRKVFNSREEGVPQARVIKSTKETVVLKVTLPIYKSITSPTELMRRLEYMPKVDVYEVNCDFVPKAMLRSINRLKKGICDHVLGPAPDFRRGFRQFEADLQDVQPTLSAYTSLNERQTGVLYSVCTSAHADAPYVLHGPPGTGKTRVIAATVRCLLEMDPDFRILLTAPSNMAADMIAHKLMENFAAPVMTTGNVLRLRSTGNDFASRDRRLDPIARFDAEEEAFKIPDAQELFLKRVIICTLGCTAHLVQRLVPGHFSHIFLDEAGQASEGEIWIPIGGLATRTTSIVFCGDDRQLGPVCTLDLSKEISEKFESPLVRYSKLPLYKKDKRLLGQLNRSYRCHSSILSISSEMFYSKQLLSGTGGRQEPFLLWEGLSNKDFPLMMVAVNGKEIEQNKSYGNPSEVYVVLAYLRRLTRDFPQLKPEDIGVISPYRYQTYLLTTALMSSDIPGKEKITVDSVERFQGSERKVIIVTTTRTDRLGFVACNKRLNTSITRAMHLLLVVGNEWTLSQHSSWKRFIEYAAANNAFVRWDYTQKTESNDLPTIAPRYAGQRKKLAGSQEKLPAIASKEDWHAKKVAGKQRWSADGRANHAARPPKIHPAAPAARPSVVSLSSSSSSSMISPRVQKKKPTPAAPQANGKPKAKKPPKAKPQLSPPSTSSQSTPPPVAESGDVQPAALTGKERKKLWWENHKKQWKKKKAAASTS